MNYRTDELDSMRPIRTRLGVMRKTNSCRVTEMIWVWDVCVCVCASMYVCGVVCGNACPCPIMQSTSRIAAIMLSGAGSGSGTRSVLVISTCRGSDPGRELSSLDKGSTMKPRKLTFLQFATREC